MRRVCLAHTSSSLIESNLGELGDVGRQDRPSRRTRRCGRKEGRGADNAHGVEGKPLTNLAEVVKDEATRVSHLAEDIESHKPVSEDDEPDDGV
jgi:hypothetical protein